MPERPVTESIPDGSPPQGGGMRWIPDETFRTGDDNAYREEAPAHKVALSGFWIEFRCIVRPD
jgi:formylglycine-generating enzyme